MLIKHTISDIKDLDALRNKWIRLEKGPDMTVFQSFEWNRLAYEQHINSVYNRLFSKVVVYEDDNILAPVIIQRYGFGFRWLGRKRGIYLLGEGTYSDYLNFIYNKAEFCKILEFLKYIIYDNNLPFHASRIRENTSIVNMLNEINIEPSSRSVSVEVVLPDSMYEYEKMLSKNTRQNIRTSLNRINRDSIEYDLLILNGTVDEELARCLVPIHLERVLRKNTGSLNPKKIISHQIRRRLLIHNENKNNIILNAMINYNKSTLIICIMNDEIAGYLYGLVDSDSIRILQNCLVEKYKYYSPMFRGTYDYIKRIIEDGYIKCIDFTRGDEEYKYKLGGKEVTLYNYTIDKSLIRKKNGSCCQI